MSFIEQRKDINRSSTLYSVKGCFELLHVDIVDIRFLTKLAVDPKYCLIFIDLFTSKIYTYPMKNRPLLKKKTELLYNERRNENTDRPRI